MISLVDSPALEFEIESATAYFTGNFVKERAFCKSRFFSQSPLHSPPLVLLTSGDPLSFGHPFPGGGMIILWHNEFPCPHRGKRSYRSREAARDRGIGGCNIPHERLLQMPRKITYLTLVLFLSFSLAHLLAFLPEKPIRIAVRPSKVHMRTCPVERQFRRIDRSAVMVYLGFPC